MVIGKLIAEYLATNNRIIIPQFGAFIKRPDGEIVFMSLLKTDDGVLCRLVAEAQEISDAEARRQLDIYAARSNDALNAQQRVSLDGFGYVVINDGGEAVFTTDKSLLDGKSVSEGGSSGITASEDDDAIVTESIVPPASLQPTPKQEQRRAIIELFDDEEDEPVQTAARPSRNYSAPPPSERYGGQSYTRSGQEQRERVGQNSQQQRTGNRPNQDSRPKPSERSDDARAQQNRPNTTQQQQRDRVNIRRPQRRKGKVDLVIIIAMAAILVAIIAMIYGMGSKERHVVLDEELYNTSVVEGGIPIESVYME